VGPRNHNITPYERISRVRAARTNLGRPDGACSESWTDCAAPVRTSSRRRCSPCFRRRRCQTPSQSWAGRCGRRPVPNERVTCRRSLAARHSAGRLVVHDWDRAPGGKRMAASLACIRPFTSRVNARLRQRRRQAAGNAFCPTSWARQMTALSSLRSPALIGSSFSESQRLRRAPLGTWTVKQPVGRGRCTLFA
jgi:hypothetical protein